jgi:hypothetical protein
MLKATLFIIRLQHSGSNPVKEVSSAGASIERNHRYAEGWLRSRGGSPERIGLSNPVEEKVRTHYGKVYQEQPPFSNLARIRFHRSQ